MNTVKLPKLVSLLQHIDFPHKLGFCEWIFGRELKKEGMCWAQTSTGLPWKLDLSNSTHRWIVYGKYEGAAFLNWAKEYLPSNAIVVDSGANIGQMLLYFALMVSQGKVLAFEPGKIQADWLEECLRVNQDLPIELIRSGLGEKKRSAYLCDVGPKGTHGSWSQISEAKGEPVDIVKLEDELSSRRIEKVDLWKLDVEGYEVPALEGARKYLVSGRIKAIYVEMFDANGILIKQYLEELGYKLNYFLPNGKLGMPKHIPNHTNGLFLYREL